jgi:type II secretory pathway component PulK
MILRTSHRPGYALLAVLIVVVVLSLAAYRYADSMTAEYQVAVRSSEAAQAKAYAAAGVHYAMGALSDPNTLNGTLAGNPYDNRSQFANVSLGSPDDPRGGGRFSVIAVGDTWSGSGEARYQIRYGVTDESAKLNINALIAQDPTGQVLHDALMMLPNMTEDVADAIVDWVDADDNPRDNGAESSYYQGLNPPYSAKNGPLNSLDELLLVRGVTPQLLYGNDRNRNGKRDPGEDDGNDFNRGWSEFLTVYGRELDADVNGNPRINLNDSSDLNNLSQQLTTAFGQYMSDYILAARLYGTTSLSGQSSGSGSSGQGGGSGGSGGSGQQGGGSGQSTTPAPTTGQSGGGSAPKTTVTVTMTGAKTGTIQITDADSATSSNSATVTGGPDQLRAAVAQSLSNGDQPKSKVSSVLALYNTQVTLPKPPAPAGQQQQQNTPTVVVPSPLNDSATMNQLLPQLLDQATTRTGFEITPRVNVNTAPPEVLAALPGLSQDDVDTIVTARGSLGSQDPTDPTTATGAWLVTQASVKASTFQNIEKYVTGRTMTYRVHSVGYFGRGGPVARVEAVIDTNQGHPRIVYYRDVTDLGRGFDLPR